MSSPERIPLLTIGATHIPRLGFGTFRLTGEACHSAVSAALQIGFRHIDTAQMYDNEEIVGAAIATSGVSRDDIFLTTKIGNHNHGRAEVLRSVDESLDKLGTDHVDLLLIHWPVESVALAETCEAMAQVQEAGKARHLGVSNFTTKLVDAARLHMEVFANQVEYHVYLDQQAILTQARRYGHAVTAYAPMARASVMEDSTVASIAAHHQASPTAVALAWLLSQDQVVAIPKATSRAHILSNFSAVEISLTAEETDALNALPKDGRLVSPPGRAPDWD